MPKNQTFAHQIWYRMRIENKEEIYMAVSPKKGKNQFSCCSGLRIEKKGVPDTVKRCSVLRAKKSILHVGLFFPNLL
jgi:hypothetical protein